MSVDEKYNEIVDLFTSRNCKLLENKTNLNNLYSETKQITGRRGWDIIRPLIVFSCGHEGRSINLNHFKSHESYATCLHCRYENRLNVNFIETIKIFKDKNCKLLSSNDELKTQIYKSKNKRWCEVKCRYIASCGHENQVMLASLVNNSIGLLCKKCEHERKKKFYGEIFNDEEGSFFTNLMETNAIEYLEKCISSVFEIKRCFESCKADCVIRPLHSTFEDKWLPIQIKSTYKKGKNGFYNFYLGKKNYTNMLIFCHCVEKRLSWVYCGNEEKEKWSISTKEHKNKDMEVDETNLPEKLLTYFQKMVGDTSSMEDLNVVANNYFVQREQKFSKLRQDTFKEILFQPPLSQQSAVDFIMFGKFRVQEKVSSHFIKKMNHYEVRLCRTNQIDNKMIRSPYEKGNNHFYWINIDKLINDKLFFYLIPENELCMYGYIKTENKKGRTSIPLCISDESKWYNKYLLEYSDNEAKTTERLKNIVFENTILVDNNFKKAQKVIDLLVSHHNYKVQKLNACYKKERTFSTQLFYKSKENINLFEAGMFDFYFVNVNDKKNELESDIFYLFPENVLVEKGYIKTKNNEAKKTIILYPFKKTMWYNKYLFEFQEKYDDLVQKIKSVFSLKEDVYA